MGGEDIILKYKGQVPYCAECNRGYKNSSTLLWGSVALLIVATFGAVFALPLLLNFESTAVSALTSTIVLLFYPLSIAGIIVAITARRRSETFCLKAFDEKRMLLEFGNSDYERLFLEKNSELRPSKEPISP